MLDGSVGLFADLAHLAQAAAFAREVGWVTTVSHHPLTCRTREIVLYLSTMNGGIEAVGQTIFCLFRKRNQAPSQAANHRQPKVQFTQRRKQSTTHRYDYRACSVSEDGTVSISLSLNMASN